MIENQTAYDAAVKRAILSNANKTFQRTYPDHEEICAFIEPGRIPSKRGFTYKEGFVGSLAHAYDVYGKLTPGQVDAVRKCIAQRNERRAEWADKQAALNASRQHVGTVGKRITLTLTVVHFVRLDSIYGVTYIFVCEDADRNIIVYKGAATCMPNKGETVTVSATVKEHGVRDGVKQTIIQRPKAV
jgi:hypothetical protein